MRDHVASMSDDTPSDVLGSLPRTRPHRRSTRRAARPAGGNGNGAPTVEAPPKPARKVAAKAQSPAKPKAKATSSAAKKTATRAARPTTSGNVRATTTGTARPATTRTARAATPRRPKPTRLRQPAQPAGTPTTPRNRKPVPTTGADVVGTAVQAAAELAEIGLSVSARAVRRAVSRLPRP
jgi:hypothetical protein